MEELNLSGFANIEMQKMINDGVTSGYQLGFQSALDQLGYFVYITPALLLLSLAMNVMQRKLPHMNRTIKIRDDEIKIFNFLENVFINGAIATSVGLAGIFYSN